ncbi:tetratricopeptide repeat protein [Amycolatopsis sp. NPDC101161]|uniref:tetratricopeptide repeat protein n=1 Tax=Amycolatopsis sp. NPDC101161 TaxID=3363940 RepID=UPI003823DDF1
MTADEVERRIAELSERLAALADGGDEQRATRAELAAALAVRYVQHGGPDTDRVRATELADLVQADPASTTEQRDRMSQLALTLTMVGKTSATALRGHPVPDLASVLNTTEWLAPASPDQLAAGIAEIRDRLSAVTGVDSLPPEIRALFELMSPLADLMASGTAPPSEATVAKLDAVLGSTPQSGNPGIELLRTMMPVIAPAPEPAVRARQMRELLDGLPEDHMLTPMLRADLATHLVGKAGQGGFDDLRQAEELLKQASVPDEHPLSDSIRRQLAGALLASVGAEPTPERIAEAEHVVDRVLAGTAEAGPDRYGAELVLRSMLAILRGAQGDAGQTAAGVTGLLEAVRVLPADHELHAVAVGLVGGVLADRHLALGLLEDTDSAAALLTKAAEPAGDSPVDGSVVVAALAASTEVSRALRVGDDAGLSVAVDRLDEAVARLPAAHVVRPSAELLSGLVGLRLALTDAGSVRESVGALRARLIGGPVPGPSGDMLEFMADSTMAFARALDGEPEEILAAIERLEARLSRVTMLYHQTTVRGLLGLAYLTAHDRAIGPADFLSRAVIHLEQSLQTADDVARSEVLLVLARARRGSRQEQTLEVGSPGDSRTADFGPVAHVPPTAVLVQHAQPQMLGVHRAIRLDPVQREEQEDVERVEDGLPPYVLRDLDVELRARLNVAQRNGGFVLLVGGSTVGKTRTLFEAVRAVLPDWWLIHPRDPETLQQFVAEPARRTVVWLDELQRYLDRPGGVSAAVVRRLIEIGVPVVGTIWPEEYFKRVTPPVQGKHDMYAEDRSLLSVADIVHVPDTFSAAEQQRARAAASDRRIRAALDASDARFTQFVAAGPELVRWWEDAPPRQSYGQAVITAALDARRAGANAPVTRAYLADAARGYLTPKQRSDAPPDWLDQALTYATTLVHGATAALRPVASSSEQSASYVVADFLHQHALGTRRMVSLPDEAWRALIREHHPDDTRRIADYAKSRNRNREAAILYRLLAEKGDIHAAFRLADVLAGLQGFDELTARADGGDNYSAFRLAELLAEHGRVDDAIARYRSLADAGDTDAAQRLAELRSTQELLDAEERRSIAVREQVILARLRDESNSAGVAAALAELGDYEQAVSVYEQDVAHLSATLGRNHPETLSRSVSLLFALQDKGENQRALVLANDVSERAIARLGIDHPVTLASFLGLASSLRDNNDFERAKLVDEQLLSRCNELFGPFHPRSLQATTSLACDHAGCGEVEKARSLNERTLERYRLVLGRDHPDTLACAVNLIVDYVALGENRRAAELHADTLRRYRRTLGDDHPDTLLCVAAVSASSAEIPSNKVTQRWRMPARNRHVGAEHGPEEKA